MSGRATAGTVGGGSAPCSHAETQADGAHDAFNTGLPSYLCLCPGREDRGRKGMHGRFLRQGLPRHRALPSRFSGTTQSRG